MADVLPVRDVGGLWLCLELNWAGLMICHVELPWVAFALTFQEEMCPGLSQPGGVCGHDNWHNVMEGTKCRRRDAWRFQY